MSVVVMEGSLSWYKGKHWLKQPKLLDAFNHLDQRYAGAHVPRELTLCGLEGQVDG